MKRKTGVVVPLSALYTKDCEAVGDFSALKDFADFAEKCNFSVIQLLPVNDTGTQSSPYSGLSAFALHPIFIRISQLPEFQEAYKADKTFAGAYRTYTKEFKYKSRFDYDKVLAEKTRLLHLLYNHIEKKILKDSKKASAGEPNSAFSSNFAIELAKFAQENKWIIPYAVFKNLKDIAMQASWKEWDESLQHLNKKQIQQRWDNKALKSSHNFFVWCQMRAAQQFKESCEYVRQKNITLKGDIPILMNEDSVDCWAYPEFFNQTEKAGSPPDGENPVGQNWGFPTYNWDNIKKDSFTWWKDRVKVASCYYDAFRIDHILGFFRIWAVPQRELTAYLGHASPCATFTLKELQDAGFSEGRIHWLAEPHIPTSLIEDITWNKDEANDCLQKVCNRLGTEELWNFKQTLKGDKDILETHFFDDAQKDNRVKNALVEKWKDRTLLKFSEEEFTFVYSFKNSTAWNSLSQEEKEELEKIHTKMNIKENELWKTQALTSLKPICQQTKMTACAEDLGVNLECMQEVLNELSIMSLKVIRWNRFWQKEEQPYVPLNQYPQLSVTTTSVHDSSTLRQWWNSEKQSVVSFLNLTEEDKALSKQSSVEKPNANENFIANTAQFCLELCANTKSLWFINPLQDYLFLEQKYFLSNADDERINIPGSVNTFNWTYRIPTSIEELTKDEILIKKIQDICNIHDKNI